MMYKVVEGWTRRGEHSCTRSRIIHEYVEPGSIIENYVYPFNVLIEIEHNNMMR